MPAKPPIVPYRDPATTQSAITVDYVSLSGTATGGAPILSYELQWDAGTNGSTWTSLTGYSTYSTATQYVVTTGIVSGTSYQFKYRALNRQGWGNFSNVGVIIAAQAPA